MYRSCLGCELYRQPCGERDRVREQIRGLGVTSIKWRCKQRTPIIDAGDPVWVDTVNGSDDYDDHGNPYRDEYPGTAIRQVGTKMLVYIEKHAPGRNAGDDAPFMPRAGGFCKIPFSRIKRREGKREDVCASCDLPASKGHRGGYICERRLRSDDIPNVIPF